MGVLIENMPYTINGAVLIICIIVPIIWACCAWITVERPELGLYPLGAALLGTIIISILPRLEINFG
jgi:hypothetical protein